MKITLLRHGQPDFKLAGYAKAADLASMASAYDRAGIADSPPPEVIQAVSDHQRICCSDLRRATESAQALGFSVSQVQTSRLFRETAIPHFDRGAVYLPVSVWLVLLRAFWFAGFSKNGESFQAMKLRASAASDRLMVLASEYQNVLLVGHGFLNRYIAVNLLQAGWSGPRAINQKYWSYASYEYLPAR
ncbi:MAG: histidine phosphatase family protein [Gammaproteobacteria bacterium]|nr:histidine phosphatase family protein [Gammaproteobacteria bacterium]